MSKLKTMGFIIAFWLILPFPFMFVNVGGFDTLDFDKLKTSEKPATDVNIIWTFFEYGRIGLTLLTVYLQILFIWVYGAPLFINIFLWFLRIMSGFVLLLILRGSN